MTDSPTHPKDIEGGLDELDEVFKRYSLVDLEAHQGDTKNVKKAILALTASTVITQLERVRDEVIGADDEFRRNHTIKRVMEVRNKLRAIQRQKLDTIIKEWEGKSDG